MTPALDQSAPPIPRAEAPAPAVPLAWPVVLSALAGLAAAWIAAGSTGLLGHPLRHALTWLAAGACALLGCAGAARWLAHRIALVAAVAVAVAMTASPLVPVNVMAVALVLAVVAMGQTGAARSALTLASASAGVLGVYRLAVTSIPTLWTGADELGWLLGLAVGRATGKPLWIGATLGGVDFLVLAVVFYVGWVASLPASRWRGAVSGAVAILGGHFLYLIAVVYASASGGELPEAVAAKAPFLAEGARAAVPWLLPALAAVTHLLIAGSMLRWSRRPAEAPPDDESAVRWRWPARPTTTAVTALVAAVLPVAVVLSPVRPTLEGKKVVVNKEGVLNWLKAEHGDYGRLSVGMYGLLPTFIESLGGQCVVSPDVSVADLDGADVLVLIYQKQPWAEGQRERIWEFVRGGGSLLVLGEHTERAEDGGCRFNEILEPTAMQVRFDSATFAVGGWLQSYETLAHPATTGIADDRNQFGVVIGASVEARWPARPVLVGRYGWADPGDESNPPSMMGNHRYDPGERLGDLVLVAEQSMGKGTVVVFGDTSSLTNGITVGSHLFTSRLLASLASRPMSPQALWRQGLGLVVAAALVVLLLRRASPWRTGFAAAALAASLVVCTGLSYRAADVLPDGRPKKPNNLAYIDATHLESSSAESWREDGVMGLTLTLVRNGYLALDLPEFTPERLERAGLVVSIAPRRPFTAEEVKAVRRFVENGGIWISTVGYEARGPSETLLWNFGFRVGACGPKCDPSVHIPQPLGHFKSPYVDLGQGMAHVRFHAAWPVACVDPDAQVLAYGRGDVPVIVLRRVGKGKVVLVGDTGFAMNKNLERTDGQAIEGLRENADFWRWFLTVLRDEPMWRPALPGQAESQPPAAVETPPAEAPAAPEAAPDGGDAGATPPRDGGTP